VHPTTISKLNTFLQLGLIGATLTLPLLVPEAGAAAIGGFTEIVREGLGGSEGVQTAVRGLQGVVATTTVWSGLSYVWTKDAVRILGTDEALKRKQGYRGRMVVAGSFGVVLAITVWLGWRDWVREKEKDKDGS
jgi:cardiolipin synthase